MIDNTLFIQEGKKEETVNFATIAGIFEDGVTLRFDGETSPTQKHYKVNAFAVFKVNDRVRIIKDSGTYIVEYAVGNPKTSFNADTATTASTAINATNAANANTANTAGSAGTCDSARFLLNTSDSEPLFINVNASKKVSINYPRFGWIVLN